MKGKLENEGDGQLEGENGSRQWANGQYGQRKSRSKRKPGIGLRLATDQNGKISTYSSSSRLTSLLRGPSVSEADSFRGSESTYYNQLAEKYVPRGTAPQKVREQMQLVLERKRSEIEALRVHRDELKFLSFNNPYDMPIKISLAVLKEKARAEQKIRDMVMLLQKDIRQIEFEFNTMTDYYNFISNAVKSNCQEDLIIDTHEEEQLMIQNLEKETNHLFRELKEQDKKNAKEIKSMTEEIGMLRVYIKQKEDTIRDLKSKICTLHIKLHSRTGSSSKEKSLSLSVRKFITDQNNKIQQAFIGNNSFKSYSKQLLQKVTGSEQLNKLIFYYQPKKELLTFRCIYKESQGKLHSMADDVFNNANQQPNKIKKDPKTIIVKVKYLLSIKFYFKSKIVGVECRMKSEKGTELVKLGNCENNLEHQLLTLINKKVVTVGSYWHNKDLIGVGIWFCSKLGRTTSKQGRDGGKLTARPNGNFTRTSKEEAKDQYYQI